MASAPNEMSHSSANNGGSGCDLFVKRVQEIRIGDKYQLMRKLGGGGFGKVYLGRDLDTGREVAIKLEHCMSRPQLLQNEVNVYHDMAGKIGFPQLHWDGDVDEFKVLVLELLGPSLEDLLRYCGGRFSLKTTLLLADQLLQRLEVLHSHHYLHSDITPRNFLLGRGHRGNVVHVADFGLTFPHNHPSNGSSYPATHLRQIPLTYLVGTANYASINGHKGGPESACDELESLGYVLVYLAKGKLPWQHIQAQPVFVVDQHPSLRISFMKSTMSAEELCEGLPDEFAKYMNYVHGLEERDQPDYRHLRRLFDNLFRRQGFEYDNVFDWTRLEFLRLEAAADTEPSTVPGVVDGSRGGTAI
ncbi:Casein kinase I isoform delta [Fonsecaea pedrosoi]|nr:Casein kinase I isoform delta [Fonsecaea pedrosoi]